MFAIILAIVMAFILQLALWEGVVLGLAWLIGLVAGISINFTIIGLIVIVVWLTALAFTLLSTRRREQLYNTALNSYTRLKEENK